MKIFRQVFSGFRAINRSWLSMKTVKDVQRWLLWAVSFVLSDPTSSRSVETLVSTAEITLYAYGQDWITHIWLIPSKDSSNSERDEFDVLWRLDEAHFHIFLLSYRCWARKTTMTLEELEFRERWTERTVKVCGRLFYAWTDRLTDQPMPSA